MLKNKYHFTKKELVRLYVEKNKTMAEIGQIKGCNWGTVRQWLKKFNIPTRKNGIRVGVYKGERHWDWKGGKYKKEGYIFIKKESHPKARSMKGYVREHVLVIEDHIGRHLIAGEVVHHLNGRRDDNRIENLIVTSQSDHMRLHQDDKGVFRAV